MRQGNFLITHWENEKDSFRKNLNAFNGIDPELIHKIRVNIKKLRAYLNLYLLVYKNRGVKKLFRETEELFSVLGQHRNFDILKEKVNEDLNNHPRIIKPYLDWMESIQAQLTSISDSLTQYTSTGLDEISAVMKGTIGHLDSIKLGRKTAIINQHLLKKIRVHLNHFRRNFHRIRKDLKSIFYQAKISPEIGFSQRQIDMLNNTLDVLGDIQDNEVCLDFIHRYGVSIGINSQAEILKAAEVSIKQKKREMLKKANKKTLKFLETSLTS